MWERMMKSLLPFLAILLLASNASADLVFNLDREVTGNALGSANFWGTITLKENAGDPDKIDIKVDLVGNVPHKTLTIYLNWDDSVFSNSDDFSGASFAIGEDEDNQKIAGYNVTGGKFDLKLPPTGNGGFEPFLDTISLADFDLNLAHFKHLTDNGVAYAGVHIGNYGGSPGVGGNDSISVIATTFEDIEEGPLVPEPASLVAWSAFGLLGCALARRRRVKSPS